MYAWHTSKLKPRRPGRAEFYEGEVTSPKGNYGGATAVPYNARAKQRPNCRASGLPEVVDLGNPNASVVRP